VYVGELAEPCATGSSVSTSCRDGGGAVLVAISPDNGAADRYGPSRPPHTNKSCALAALSIGILQRRRPDRWMSSSQMLSDAAGRI